MRRFGLSFVVGIVLFIAGAGTAHSADMSKVSCGAFIASGRDNMAAMIMWLRGYHAGRNGVIDATDIPGMREYGGRLGQYCKAHPSTGLIDASELILKENHGP
jgi:hypothetical protein